MKNHPEGWPWDNPPPVSTGFGGDELAIQTFWPKPKAKSKSSCCCPATFLHSLAQFFSGAFSERFQSLLVFSFKKDWWFAGAFSPPGFAFNPFVPKIFSEQKSFWTYSTGSDHFKREELLFSDFARANPPLGSQKKSYRAHHRISYFQDCIVKTECITQNPLKSCHLEGSDWLHRRICLASDSLLGNKISVFLQSFAVFHRFFFKIWTLSSLFSRSATVRPLHKESYTSTDSIEFLPKMFLLFTSQICGNTKRKSTPRGWDSPRSTKRVARSQLSRRELTTAEELSFRKNRRGPRSQNSKNQHRPCSAFKCLDFGRRKASRIDRRHIGTCKTPSCFQSSVLSCSSKNLERKNLLVLAQENK